MHLYSTSTFFPPEWPRGRNIQVVNKWEDVICYLYIYLQTNFKDMYSNVHSYIKILMDFIQRSRPSYVSTYLNFLTVQIVQCLHVSIYRLLNT